MEANARRILILLVLSIFVNYVDRGNLSIAAPLLEKELGLGPVQMGQLLAAFFWTYALLQLFGIAGWFADKFDVGLVLAWGYFLWSAATALTPVFDSFAALFVMRLLLGVGESLAYPCYAKILARYFSEEQRGLANSLLDSGSKLGPALGTLFGGLAMAEFGWRAVFVALGVGGSVWLIPWLRWRPRVSADGEHVTGRMPGFAEILRLRATWGTFAGHFCANYFWFFLLTWLPSYLVKERGMSIQQMSKMGALVFFVMAAATVCAGWLADRWISRGMSVTRARKTMTVFGLLSSTIILPVAAIEDHATALTLLVLSCMGFGVFVSSHYAITQTFAGPLAAGRWTGVQNGVANLAGIVAPWLTGVVVASTGRFYLAFLIAGVVALTGAAMYAFVVPRVEPVQWGEGNAVPIPG